VLDPRDPACRDDPYPYYARLRSEAPFLRTSLDGEEVWLVSRYEDCLRILRDRRFSVPPHLRPRGPLAEVLGPRFVESLRPRVAEIATDLLDRAEERGAADLVADFAFEVPARVACELLGVPARDRHLFRAWLPELSRGFEPVLVSSEERARCDAATEALGAYFEEHVRRRRGGPGRDLLSSLTGLDDAGRVASCLQVLDAACETPMALIGNGALALARHPDQRRRLREDPHLAVSAVEECLRWDSPVQVACRIAEEEVFLDGLVIERSRMVLALLGSANRDPAVFEDPDTFQIERSGPPHLSFGCGERVCLGAHLARMEAQIALRLLVRRFPELHVPDVRLVRRPSLLLRSLECLPVVLAN